MIQRFQRLLDNEVPATLSITSYILVVYQPYRNDLKMST